MQFYVIILCLCSGVLAGAPWGKFRVCSKVIEYF